MSKKVAVCFDYEGQWGMPFKADYDLETTTHHLLNILDIYKIKATFFTVGKLIEEHPQLVKHIAARGHTIELHGYEHDHINTYDEATLAQFAGRVSQSSQQIKNLTGRAPTGFRAPFLMSPAFYVPAVYEIFEKNHYTWTSNRELRYAEELFRPGRLGLRSTWGKNGFIMRWLGAPLNVAWFVKDKFSLANGRKSVISKLQWLMSGPTPFRRGALVEVPVYSPLDCDLLGTPSPSTPSPQELVDYATACYIGGVNRPGSRYSVNFHDWLIGTSNRIQIFEDTLKALAARPDVEFCTSEALAYMAEGQS